MKTHSQYLIYPLYQTLSNITHIIQSVYSGDEICQYIVENSKFEMACTPFIFLRRQSRVFDILRG